MHLYLHNLSPKTDSYKTLYMALNDLGHIFITHIYYNFAIILTTCRLTLLTIPRHVSVWEENVVTYMQN
jgi:hypothetical protein